MGLLEDIRPYKFGEWDAISNHPGKMCDNFHLFNSHYRHILELNNLEDSEHSCKTRKFIQACSKYPGLIARYPTRFNDDTSQDELEGAASFGFIFARLIYHWGMDHAWHFDVAQPERYFINYYFARHLHFAPFIFACANVTWPFHHYLDWCGTLLESAKSDYEDTSGKLFMWNQVWIMEKLKGKNWVVKFAINRWKRKMQNMYSNGPSELLGIYFGKDHPLTVYAPIDF